MELIEYFKLQAKNLHKDFKTKKLSSDEQSGKNRYIYEPRFFNVDTLILDFKIDEEDFTLMKAQHIIAKLSGFEKWSDFPKASPPALILSLMLFDQMHKISIENWKSYISRIEAKNKTVYDDESRLDIFRMVFEEDDEYYGGREYRLIDIKDEVDELEFTKPSELAPREKITSLPLEGVVRQEFIETANDVFNDVLNRIESKHPKLIRRMWDVESYIDKELLKPEMLPIDYYYALSLIDAFLVHHVIALAVEADKRD
ncbi:hypothetical protein [Pedobacter sp.]|uniref:hypothetical protein n=1 Tax=Pedobacter sp. TaxID=1411316 RepID=UPI0031E1424D